MHVISRVLTMLNYSNMRKTTPPPGGRVYQRTVTIFELSYAIIRTNNITKLHVDWTINVTSRVLTRSHNNHIMFYYSHKCFRKISPPSSGLVVQRTKTIFELS
ncbi:hypothetical protein DPMN_167030 [Dreissena polymorpha]|uniref:Uncharacterized protein n=1 Tax=Dreissena polymorpha TaxID=45954 RepID=A0A9D4F3N4_DREPO|nr:hypothetical protein DPMN_167030 [Dreissena polymorpha]